MRGSRQMSRATLGLAAAAFFTLLGAGSQDAAAADRRILVINDTSVPLVTFNASNVTRKSWEEDILGQRVLPPGERVVVNINDGSGSCRFDLRAIFADKDVVIRRDFNVCTQTYWRIYNRQ